MVGTCSFDSEMSALGTVTFYDTESCMACATGLFWGSGGQYPVRLHCILVSEVLRVLEQWFGRHVDLHVMNGGPTGLMVDPSHRVISTNSRTMDPRDVIQEVVHGFAHVALGQECVLTLGGGGTHDYAWVTYMSRVIRLLRRLLPGDLPPMLGCLASGGVMAELHVRPGLCHHALAALPPVSH